MIKTSPLPNGPHRSSLPGRGPAPARWTGSVVALALMSALAGCRPAGPSVAAFCSRSAAVRAARQALDAAALGPGVHDPTTMQLLSDQVVTLDATLAAGLAGRLGSDGRTVTAADSRLRATLGQAGFHDDQVTSPLSPTDAAQAQLAASDLERYRQLVCPGVPEPAHPGNGLSVAQP